MKTDEGKDDRLKRVFNIKVTLTPGVEAVPMKFVRRQQLS